MNTGSALARFTITLSQAVTEPVQVEWFTSDGTAKAGVDYAENKGTAVFAPGETSKTVDILVYGRAVGSENRSFFVEMLPPTNAILGAAIGECIITVDTSGSTPVTAIIIPTGPQGIQGKSAYQSYVDTTTDNPPMTEPEWVESLKGDPAEIAEEVAPLIDVGNTALVAEGTNSLGHPDSTTVKAVARRVAYATPAHIGILTLADGDNTIQPSDLTGDAIDFLATGFVPKILRGGSMFEPEWISFLDGKITIKNAVAGDVLYAVQYGATSEKRHYFTANEVEEFLGKRDGRKYVGRCANIAELRTTEPGADKQWVDVKEYETGSKIPQGSYWHDASDTTSADNGGRIIVTTGGKRWKFIGFPTVETYGAYADGVHDDADAFKRCIQAEGTIRFPGAKYIIGSPLQPVRSQQIFQGNGETKLSTPNGGNIFEFVLTYREGVQFRDFALMSETPGTGKGFYSPSSIYIANPVLQNINFHASLAFGIDANFILEVVRDCRFGLEGTLGSTYQHIRMTGQTPVGSNLTTNAGLYENCRFFRSNSAYGIDMVNGLQKMFTNCDFETNNNTAGIIRQAGMLTFHFDRCWWERNAGVQLVKVQMDSTGTTQGNAVTTFDKCWIKLDGTGNTAIVVSDTPNFNVSYKHCAGTGLSGKQLFIVGVTNTPLQYLREFTDNYLVGFSVLPQNIAWFPEVRTAAIEFDDTVTGARLGKIISNTTRIVLSHNVGLIVQNESGQIIAEIVTTPTGTQFRGRSQNGVLMKLQPPVDGIPAPAQWTTI